MTSLESLCVACTALSLMLVYSLPTLSALPMPSYLEWNAVSAIAPESFAGLSALQGLYVHWSPASEIPHGLSTQRNAARVRRYLGYNQLTSPPFLALASLSSLRVLYVRGMRPSVYSLLVTSTACWHRTGLQRAPWKRFDGAERPDVPWAAGASAPVCMGMTSTLVCGVHNTWCSGWYSAFPRSPPPPRRDLEANGLSAVPSGLFAALSALVHLYARHSRSQWRASSPTPVILTGASGGIA
jgi:hypothetical protein